MESENKYRLPEEQQFEVFGQMMTETEHDAWVDNNISRTQPKVSNQLLEACLFSDLEGVKDGLQKLSDRSVLEDVNLYSIPTPLYHLTLLNQMVFDTEYWTDLDDEDKKVVAWMEKRTKQVVEFWKEYYSVNELPQPEYDKYTEADFYRAWEDDDEEDILDASKDKFLRYGCREVDIDLYIAAERFQFENVESILRKGANPCATLCYEEASDDSLMTYNRIGTEVVYLTLELLPIFRKLFAGKQSTPYNNIYFDLLGLAEHVKMEKLFEKYCHIWDNNDDKESI